MREEEKENWSGVRGYLGKEKVRRFTNTCVKGKGKGKTKKKRGRRKGEKKGGVWVGIDIIKKGNEGEWRFTFCRPGRKRGGGEGRYCLVKMIQSHS